MLKKQITPFELVCLSIHKNADKLRILFIFFFKQNEHLNTTIVLYSNATNSSCNLIVISRMT
jgi:hypothetical protein